MSDELDWKDPNWRRGFNTEFSSRLPGGSWSLAEELAKVGLGNVGELYESLLEVQRKQSGLKEYVARFDVLEDNNYFVAVLARLLYAAALSGKIETDEVLLLADMLREAVHADGIPLAETVKEESTSRSPENDSGVATTISHLVARAVASSSAESAVSLYGLVQKAAIPLSAEGTPESKLMVRRYLTGLVMRYMVLVLSNAEEIQATTASLAGERVVFLTERSVDQLGRGDILFLMRANPLGVASFFARLSPELQNDFLGRLTNDRTSPPEIE